MCPNMHITTIAMRDSMYWIAKSMISMTCWTHSRPEMILRMIECVGCLGSCIASMCLRFVSLCFVSFSWLFLFLVDWLYQLYGFIFCFQFLLVVFCSNINEMICNACYLYAFVLFDEPKGGEKLIIKQMDQIGLNKSIKIGIKIKYESEPILLIEGACAYLYACYCYCKCLSSSQV